MVGSFAKERTVDRVLRLGEGRFDLVSGYLPHTWTSLGVDPNIVARAHHRTATQPASTEADLVPDVATVINQWLAHPMVDAMV